MPWGVAAGVLGSAAGAAVSSAMAPDTSGGGGSYYIPTGLKDADNAWQQLFQNQIAAYNNNSNPLYQLGQQSLQQGLDANNAYGANYQQAANWAGQQYGNNANRNQNFSDSLANQAGWNFGQQTNLMNTGLNLYNTLAGAGNQVFNTAMDPQSALYNRTVQQLQDQTGATNSMYGLGSSAAGAGVANQALSNFNIDWQNQQLGRQLQGLQGLAGAYGQGAGSLGSLYGTGAQYANLANQQLGLSSGFAGQSAQDTLNAGQIPYQVGQGIAATPGNLSNAAQQNLQNTVYGPSQALTGQAIPYMNYGQGAQSVPYQNSLQGAGAAGSLVSQGFNSIAGNQNVQNAFGNLFSGGSSGGAGNFGSLQSPGNYSGAGYGGFGQGSGAGYYGGGGNTYGFTLS